MRPAASDIQILLLRGVARATLAPVAHPAAQLRNLASIWENIRRAKALRWPRPRRGRLRTGGAVALMAGRT